MNKDSKGNLFVISAPSGAGKSSLINSIIEKSDSIQLSISATTRSPRMGEEDGKHYFFITDNDFDVLKSQHAFIENAIVHNYQYGTLKSHVQEKLDNGINIILDIDVQGFKQIQNTEIQHTSIFIVPPSIEELEERLLKRGLDSDDVINTRLLNAKKELEHANEFDFRVLNDNFDLALENIANIVTEKI